MKLHSNTLDTFDISRALQAGKNAGLIADDIYFTQFNPAGSRKRARGFEIQLGTHDKSSGPTNSRYYKNSGNSGADSVWAATYDEWGWFIAYLFASDPEAIFGPYLGLDSFNQQTKNKFLLS